MRVYTPFFLIRISDAESYRCAAYVLSCLGVMYNDVLSIKQILEL